MGTKYKRNVYKILYVTEKNNVDKISVTVAFVYFYIIYTTFKISHSELILQM